MEHQIIAVLGSDLPPFSVCYLQVDMGCLLRLPKAVHKIVLRNVILMSPCLLYTKRRSWEDWDVSVDRFTIHLPGGTDRSWVLTEKLYEVVNTFAEPLSPDEMEDLRRYNTLDAPDDTLDYWDRLADIITGFVWRLLVLNWAKVESHCGLFEWVSAFINGFGLS